MVTTKQSDSLMSTQRSQELMITLQWFNTQFRKERLFSQNILQEHSSKVIHSWLELFGMFGDHLSSVFTTNVSPQTSDV